VLGLNNKKLKMYLPTMPRQDADSSGSPCKDSFEILGMNDISLVFRSLLEVRIAYGPYIKGR
jgi:hypothetical protein